MKRKAIPTFLFLTTLFATSTSIAATSIDKTPLEALNGAVIEIDGPVALHLEDAKFDRRSQGQFDMITFGIQKGRALNIQAVKELPACSKIVPVKAGAPLDEAFYAKAQMFSGQHLIQVLDRQSVPSAKFITLRFLRPLREEGTFDEFGIQCIQDDKSPLTIGTLKKALGLRDRQLRIAFNVVEFEKPKAVKVQSAEPSAPESSNGATSAQ